MSITIDSNLVRAVKMAQLAQSGRKIENAAASGEYSDQDLAEALKLRAMLRAEQAPRVTRQSASLDDLASDIANHLNASGVGCEFVVTDRYTEGKRKGEAQTVVLYNDDKLSVTMTRSNAKAVLDAFRTFYPVDAE